MCSICMVGKAVSAAHRVQIRSLNYVKGDFRLTSESLKNFYIESLSCYPFSVPKLSLS